MINYLQNCQKSTPIGMVPDIINHNNLAINDEFAWIYDIAMDRLTKSVYAPTGSVKAHKGEFVNLSCEYLTVKNINSLKTYIKEVIDGIIEDNIDYHNTLKGRFSDSSYQSSSYCHDAASIVYENNTTVYDIIENIENGNMVIKYGNEVYTAALIASLIEWKKRLVVTPIKITNESGEVTTYDVICER